MAESTKTATAIDPKPKTITLTFGDEDQGLYETIITDAKADRRSPSQFLVIYLSAHYDSTPDAV